MTVKTNLIFVKKESFQFILGLIVVTFNCKPQKYKKRIL